MKKPAPKEPPPCDPEIFKKGEGICTFHAKSAVTEPWVVKVREESGQRVDWHYSGGMVNMLYIGDYQKVVAAIEKLYPELEAACKKAGYERGPEHFRIHGPGAHGLYRQGDEVGDDIVGVDTH
jgi:hypothetical protein